MLNVENNSHLAYVDLLLGLVLTISNLIIVAYWFVVPTPIEEIMVNVDLL